MLMEAAKYSFLLLLFGLVTVSLRGLLELLVRRRRARVRLTYFRQGGMGSRMRQAFPVYSRLLRHLSDQLEVYGTSMRPGSFVLGSFLLFLAGFVAGALAFGTVKGVLTLSVMAVAAPYLLLRLALVSLQLRTRMDFLPAVEVLYQSYVLASPRNMRVVLKSALEGERMRYPLKPVFEQLHRNLSANRGVEESLRLFASSLGHVWADYLTGILRIALTEGNDVSENLKELIGDMRRSQLADEVERNRLLEIRIANFSPLLFLGLFLIVNFKLNPENAYHYYLLDPEGRSMLLDAFLLIFASFGMGVYLSMKRM
ncbi:hypothetical protein J31TS4_44280 [Paenibacillus sp. J31TS4]|uniref:type II secretion system F family protein n=1 Tax=Paenibacillus sp. J31TS4 TaxID=2807195 RepID=UPI001B0C56A4|nr:hypothetical protein [Paenibacillus sp. J31TS4]GIP41148.1 hypothetical protein J31TS4_44280 [Paenibacillus sp. J31TS4]